MSDSRRPVTPGSRVLASLRRPGWGHARALLLLASAGLAYNGARILNDSSPSAAPVLDNFDSSLPWLGLALLLVVVAAWRPASLRFSPRELPSRLAAFGREHWLELLLFAGIFAFGVFMRVYRFGSTLPPSNGLCCEEQINGGVAYKALHGLRPLNFLITRWGAAAGFAAFGESTFGLRFFFLMLSIVTLVAFYLLLREMVSVQAALFGLALYAAAWWPSLRARQPTEGTIYAVLFALVLVRGLKTKNPLLFLSAGVLAALLSYEYEPFKAVPIAGVAFLAAAAAREVLLRMPYTLDAAIARARTLLAAGWRPALLALLAAGIVLVPMVVGTHRGYDLYLTSVHRQESDRNGGRIASAWRTQLKWEAEIFLPVGPNSYPATLPRDVPGKEVLDPLAGWLALVGLVYGAALCLRGARALFVIWVALSIGAGALLLHDFGPWKFIVLVPVLLALAALLVDDLRTFAVRRYGAQGARVVAALLVIGAAFSFWWNADTLFNQIAPSASLAASYGGEHALIYEVCHELQGRGASDYAFVASDYAFVASDADALAAFNLPRDTFDQQARAWGDYIWTCHDLQGAALPAPEEAWPLRAPAGRPVTLVLAGTEAPSDAAIAELKSVYPNLGEPKRISGPAGSFTYLAWQLVDRSALYTPGLWAQYSAVNGTATAARADPVNDLSWAQTPAPLAAPFTVRWSGLVYLDAPATLGLRAVTDDPVSVRLDGQVVYDTISNQRPKSFVDLVAGWHVVEITLDKQQDGGALHLAWATPSGAELPVSLDDLFPLAQVTGWVQQRSLGVVGEPDQQVAQRLDFAPHYVRTQPVELAAQQGTVTPYVTKERWRGVWQVEEQGVYVLRAQFSAGTVTLLVDGAPSATSDSTLNGPGELEATVTLQPGRHTLELLQELPIRTDRAGLLLSALRQTPNGAPQPVPLSVTPY